MNPEVGDERGRRGERVHGDCRGRRGEGGDRDRIRNLEVGSSGRKEATFAHHRFAKGASERARAVPAINKRRLFDVVAANHHLFFYGQRGEKGQQMRK